MFEGEYIEIVQNPKNIPYTTELPTEPPTPDFTLAIVAGVVGAAAIILVGGFVILRKPK